MGEPRTNCFMAFNQDVVLCILVLLVHGVYCSYKIFSKAILFNLENIFYLRYFFVLAFFKPKNVST
jgi:hypothetical protein